MTRLHQRYDRYGQSPWLDNLTRGDLTGGRLGRLVARGIRGVTSNPTIIATTAAAGATGSCRWSSPRPRPTTARPAWPPPGSCTGASPHPTCW